jgi:site-specific DNA-methyltransferase (adenine-specific)
MGTAWDGGDVAFRPDVWRAVLRVLKPGAHLLAMGGTRTYHRLACAIEDAGFEIRDQVAWCYGQGFPKSLDVSKAIDREASAERKIIAPPPYSRGKTEQRYSETRKVSYDCEPQPITAPATDAAKQWSGWGTALKPAWEPICLARKPISEATVAVNVLKHGVGALNIDACRIPSGQDHADKCASVVGLDSNRNGECYGEWKGSRTDSHSPAGRWPANLVHDGSDEVLAAFPDLGKSTGGRIANISKTSAIYGGGNGLGQNLDPNEVRGDPGFGDTGSAARFFYTAKADIDDRLGSRHPTIKPVDLMQWLCRLVTPCGGLVLDPFAGSGTTGEAAFREGMRAVLIEREPEYCADIRRRMALMLVSTAERRRQAHKEKQTRQPLDNQGTLFE